MRVSELSGEKLALWVARALKLDPIQGEPAGFFYWKDERGHDESGWFAPQEDWAQGGPIIERKRITIAAIGKTELEWFAEIGGAAFDTGVEVGYGEFSETGPTPLIAGMRCLVRSEYGDEVPD